MADGIYVTMCGAAARTVQLDSVADNLANAQTPGFKASRPAFESFLPASGASDKRYAASVATNIDLRAGPTTPTQNALDVVPEDGAFLAVVTPRGDRVYTRDGRLSVDDQQRLVQNKNVVLDGGGSPIQVPTGASPRISDDGSVKVGSTVVAQLGLFKLQGPVDRVGPAQLVPGQGGRAEQAIDARVRVGEVELGNSTALEGMVQLISAQRSFDASMQALQTYRALDQRSTEVGRVR